MVEIAVQGHLRADRMSVMRKTTTKRNLENTPRSSKRQETISRRVVLKWLPVFFTNDLVHGSW